MLCQSRLHTASETFFRHEKFGSGLIFVFASILIGKDEKKLKTARENFGLSVQLPLVFHTTFFSKW